MMIPSDDTEMGTQDAAMHKTFYRSPGIASKRIFAAQQNCHLDFFSMSSRQTRPTAIPLAWS
jgi:hypothetical protein